MVILVDAVLVFQDRVAPKSPGRGLRIVFNDHLFYPASNTSPPTGQFAGTHSGFGTTLWTNLPGQAFGTAFAGGELIENEATYDLKALPGLDAGQITVRGVVPIDTTLSPFAEGATPSIAITGGTGAYKNARGQVTYEKDKPHKLEVEL